MYKLEKKEGKLIITGNIEFSNSPVVMDDKLNPYMEIKFKWNPSIDSSLYPIDENELTEVFSEQLKMDFIKYIKGVK